MSERKAKIFGLYRRGQTWSGDVDLSVISPGVVVKDLPAGNITQWETVKGEKWGNKNKVLWDLSQKDKEWKWGGSTEWNTRFQGRPRRRWNHQSWYNRIAIKGALIMVKTINRLWNMRMELRIWYLTRNKSLEMMVTPVERSAEGGEFSPRLNIPWNLCG